MNCLFCGRELKIHIRTPIWFVLTNYRVPSTLHCKLGSSTKRWDDNKLNIITAHFMCEFKKIESSFWLGKENINNRGFEKLNIIISGGFEI